MLHCLREMHGRRLDGRNDGWTDGWTNGRMNGGIGRWVEGGMGGGHGRRRMGDWGDGSPQNCRWGTDASPMHPSPNILKSTVIGCEAKYELTKKMCQGGIFFV